MKVLFFASLIEITGVPELTVEDIRNTDQLKQLLHDKFPLLKTVSYSLAINREIRHDTVTLDPSAEIALLPPFSGG